MWEEQIKWSNIEFGEWRMECGKKTVKRELESQLKLMSFMSFILIYWSVLSLCSYVKKQTD